MAMDGDIVLSLSAGIIGISASVTRPRHLL